MKKYYVEIYDKKNASGYVVQSSWFNERIFALHWALNLDFIDYDVVGIRLMSSEWDEENDTYIDIGWEEDIDTIHANSNILSVNGMSSIRNAVVEFMENNPILEKLEGDKWYSMEDELTKLLGDWTGREDDTYKVVEKGEKNGKSMGEQSR